MRKKTPTKPSKEVKDFILPHDRDESVYSDASDGVYSDDEHHDYDVNPSEFVLFLLNKGIDILYFTDKYYLHEMWVDYHDGENPCDRDCNLYGSLCLRSDCANP